MANDWIETNLGTLLKFSNGKKSPERSGCSDFPVYGSNGIIGHSDKNNAKEETIIIGRVGSYCGSVYYSSVKSWVTDNAIKASALGNNSVSFLYYLLINLNLNNWREGSGQPLINQTILKNIEVLAPPPEEQKTIAHILGSLDDKIELNRQMNETLEAMAQALFKSWFVDFDPVIDNALAAGNAIPDEFIERAEQRKGIEKKDHSDIQNLFPDEFEFTEEMGWIPKGWVVIPIYEIADFINGSSFKSKFFSDENEGLPIIKIAEIKNGISQQTKFTTQEMADKYFISDGSIVFSWSGNPDTSIDTFIWTGGDGWLNQHIFNVVLHEDKDKTFIYYLLKSLKPVFTEIARDKQTTGLGHVTVKDMKRTYTIEPSSSTLEAFARQSNPIFEKWYQNLFSSRELTKLRDTLLPKLMSGELRIPDAAALVDEVI